MKYLDNYKQYENLEYVNHELQMIVAEFFTSVGISNRFQIGEDDKVKVQGDVHIRANSFNAEVYRRTRKYDRIPFQFATIRGDFTVDGLNLTTLEGFPEHVTESVTLVNLSKVKSLKGITRIVGGILEIKNCGFESLEGFPEHIELAVDIDDIPIKTLKGLPETVNYDLTISKTKIASLEGAPKRCEGSFECTDNKSLFYLRGCPEWVGGDLRLQKNKLSNCRGLPKHIGGILNLAGNQLTSLKGCPEVIYHNFQCQVNQLTDLKGGPREVGERYDVSDNELTSLEGLPKDLTFFLASNNLSLCDPNFLKDVNIEMGCNLSSTPLHTLIMQFYQDGMATPDIIVKNFIPSLDYGYFRMVKGKPCLIEHRLLEALDELGIKTYDKTRLNYVGYYIVDENLYTI